ncbi:MAG: hypothetical protein WCL18_00455 [bacterium]
MFINTILSDPTCKQEITNGYTMKDKEEEEIVIEAENRLKPSYRLKTKINNPQEMQKIENIRKRFLRKKEEKSYKAHPKYINKPEHEDKYKAIVRKFDTRDVALNQVLEFAIGDLLEDILQELKGQHNIMNIKVMKTDEYDDVSAKTDYIIKIEYPDKESYKAFDLTTSSDTKNIDEKGRLKEVFCPHFHFNERMNFAIPRSLIIIDDKEFVFKYLRNYIQQIQTTGNLLPGEALKTRENTGERSNNIKKNIKNQLLKNI